VEGTGVEGAWLTAYAQIARRCQDDRDFGVTRYPYELGPGVNPFAGGYLEHREWPIRRGMERHASLQHIDEFEAHYVDSARFWMVFSTAAMALRGEALTKPDTTVVEDAKKFDVWGMMGVRVDSVGFTKCTRPTVSLLTGILCKLLARNDSFTSYLLRAQ
jgi:hypothetical protein